MSVRGSITNESDGGRPDDWTRDLLIGAAAKLLLARDARRSEFVRILASARTDLDLIVQRSRPPNASKPAPP